MPKVNIILGSLRAHRLGWLGLIPLAGMFLALLAIYQGHQVSKLVGQGWNPAAAYLRRGVYLSFFSLVLHLLVLAVLIQIMVLKGLY